MLYNCVCPLIPWALLQELHVAMELAGAAGHEEARQRLEALHAQRQAMASQVAMQQHQQWRQAPRYSAEVQRGSGSGRRMQR